MREKKNIGCVIQARMDSTRLPKKVLENICGTPVLGHIINRVKNSKHVSRIIIATSHFSGNDPIRDLGREMGIDVLSGDEENVLSRYTGSIVKYGFDVVTRITADDPLVDIMEMDKMIKMLIEEDLDYITNSDSSIEDYGTNLPVGLQSEVINGEALLSLDSLELLDIHKEHVTLYLEQHPQKFKIRTVKSRDSIQFKGLRLTIDTKEDMALIRAIYEELYTGEPVINDDVIFLLKNRPELIEINSSIETRYEGVENIKVKH